MRAECLDHLLWFAGSHAAGIHEDAGEPVADGPMHQQGSNRRVYSAGKAANHMPASHLRADPLDRFFDEGAGRPRWCAAADGVEKVPQYRRTLRRMADLWVELDADASVSIAHGRQRAGFRPRDGDEARRQIAYAVAVAHPHLQAVLLWGVESREERSRAIVRCRVTFRRRYADRRRPILATARMWLDAPAKLVGEQLHAVADAQDRQVVLQNCLVHPPCAGIVDAIRPAREDDALRAQPPQLVQRGARREQLAEDAALAHPPRDEVAVLRAEVQDGDHLAGRRRGLLASAGRIVRGGRRSCWLHGRLYLISSLLPALSRLRSRSPLATRCGGNLAPASNAMPCRHYRLW